MAAGDIIFEDGTIITPADLEKLIPLITNALGATAKDPSEYPVLERLDDLTSLPVFDAAYNLGRVSILRLKGVNGKNAILRVQGDMLQWSLEGSDIWNDLYSKSDLKGDPGAAANMEIGEVTSGDTPAATITGEAPNYKLNLVLVPGGKGDTGDNGKTPVLASVSAQSGETASGSFTDDGVDELGNPKYILDLTLPKGQDGQPAVFQQGTTTTLNPSEEARVEVVGNGVTPEGNPKYLLNFFIPRGQMGPAGTGTGNVLVDATGLVSGKKYLFVPNADESTAGTFVEYTPPGNATAESAGLMTSDQFQKLEKLNPSYLSNDVTGKKVEYTDAGKLLFEGKETFAVDANNELTLAGKKLRELGGAVQYLDLSPLFDAEGSPVTTTTDDFLAQVETAYVNHIGLAIIGGDAASMSILSDETTYNIIVNLFVISNNLLTQLNNDIQLVVNNFRITKADKSVLAGLSIDQLTNTGDGTKFKSDDGTYKAIGAQYLDLSPLFDSERNPVAVTTDEFVAKIVNAINNKFDSVYLHGVCLPSVIQTDGSGTYYIDFSTNNVDIQTSKSDLSLNYVSIVIDSVKNVIFRTFDSNIKTSGDGTKFLSDDGTYKEVGGDYQLPSATDSVLGGIKIGYVASEKNYPVQLDGSDKAYVNVPWTDTNTTYDLATQSANGLMSSADKTKMDQLRSYTTSTDISGLNPQTDCVYVNLNSNQSLSAAVFGNTYNGYSITVFVYTAAVRTITIPTTGNYVSMCGSSYTTKAGKWVEFNLTCIDGKWHIAKLEQE